MFKQTLAESAALSELVVNKRSCFTQQAIAANGTTRRKLITVSSVKICFGSNF
jgi:hypothetical protein